MASSVSSNTLALHLSTAAEYLGTDNIAIKETDYGHSFVKGNIRPSIGTSIKIGELELNLADRVFHESVLLITKKMPIRSHQETDQEIVTRIGNGLLYMVTPKMSSLVRSIEHVYSVNGEEGFDHGFELEGKVPSLLYVAKALKPKFVNGDSFRVPENTYVPKN